MELLLTLVACAFSTTRPVGSHIGWLHSWVNLRTSQFAPRCMRPELKRWCEMWKQCTVSETFLSTSTKCPLEDSHSRGGWLLCKIKVGPLYVRELTKLVEPRNSRNMTIYICCSCVQLHVLFLLYWPHCQHSELSQHQQTCTMQQLLFQNTPEILHHVVHSPRASFREV